MPKVAIFIPCFMDQLYPQTAVNMVKVLRKVGCEVVYNTNQTCCGQPAHNAGFAEQSKPVCEKFIQDFQTDADYIVAPSASCVAFISQSYPKIFAQSGYDKHISAITNKLYEFTEFLVDVLGVEQVGASFEHTVTFHDGCAAINTLGIRDAPRRLLANVHGLQLIEASDADVCCGFGGTFAIKAEPIATAMAQRKLANAWITDAEFVVSTEASCLMHLQGIAHKNDQPLHFLHIADVLACE